MIPTLKLVKESSTPWDSSRKVTTSRTANEIFRPLIGGDMNIREQFWILLLDRANNPIGTHLVSIGGMSGTVVDSKLIFATALTALANSIILCHNHPSGNPKPSQADIDISKQLRDAGKIIGITVLDHIILTSDGYTSFADQGIVF